MLKGAVPERALAERGISLVPYTGSVLVTGPFYIRAGSVSIYRGYDLVVQWEDAVPGIRHIDLQDTETVTVTCSDVMMIASLYPVQPVYTGSSAVVTPISNPTTILGQDGFLALSVHRQGTIDPADYPWFYVAGGINPVAATGIPANNTQVDQAYTRNYILPMGSVQFRSSNSLAASNGGVAFQGVVLRRIADSADRPFFQTATVSGFGGESTNMMLAFYEQANVAAQWGFSTGGTPAAVVRAFFTIIPIYRGSNEQTVEIVAQIYAPQWTPAAGNAIMAYGLNTNIPAIAAITYIHASGICMLMKGTQQPRPQPFFIGLRSVARTNS